MNLSSLMFIFRHSVTSAENVPSSQECTTLDPDRKDSGMLFSISDDEPKHCWKYKIGPLDTVNKEGLYF